MRDFAAIAERVARERREQAARLAPLVRESKETAAALRSGSSVNRDALDILRTQAKLIRRVCGYFPTPAPLARRMVEAASLRDGLIIVEPSAGDGAIAREIRRAGFEPLVIERDPSLRELLTKQGFKLIGQDFLEYQGESDRFLMNPPFENLQDVDHVRHAYDLLRSGGRIVSVMSQSAFFRSCPKAQDFRQWFANRGEILEELQRGTFGIADTQVAAKLVLLTG